MGSDVIVSKIERGLYKPQNLGRGGGGGGARGGGKFVGNFAD